MDEAKRTNYREPLERMASETGRGMKITAFYLDAPGARILEPEPLGLMFDSPLRTVATARTLGYRPAR